MLTWTDISARLPFKTSVGVRSLASITKAVVHHDAILCPETYDPVARYVSEANYHIGEGWGHLAYHIKVARNGTIYLCVPLVQIGYHAGNYPVNVQSIGICLDGDFSKQDPAPDQLKALSMLLHSLSTEHPEMPKLTHVGMFGHREVRLAPTFCPGPQVLSLVKAYRQGKVD